MNRRLPAEAELDADDLKSPQPPEQLNIETLRQWQSDLEGFVSQIRKRLKSLSQTMKNHRLRRKTIQPAAESDTDSVESLAMNRASEIQSAGYPERGPAPAGHQGPAGHQPAPASSFPAPISEDDPLAQLDAIKRRLAEQLENS
jgi:hypothetical protein